VAHILTSAASTSSMYRSPLPVCSQWQTK